MWSALTLAFALMLVLEGLMPFFAPGIWRESVRRVTEFSDGQLRFLGMSSMLIGLLLIIIFK